MREQHLDLLAFTPRGHIGLCPGDPTRHVSGALVDRTWHAELFQRAPGRPMRLLDQRDNFGFLGCWIPHASSSPAPFMLFLSRRFSRVRSATTLLQFGGFTAKVFHLTGRGGAGRVTRQAAFAGLQELLRPTVIHRGGNAFAAAQLGDVLLAAQSLQHNADFLLRRVLPTRPAAECPSVLVLRALCPVRISASSSLLMATMNQKSSFREVPHLVSGAMTANTQKWRPSGRIISAHWLRKPRFV